MVLCGGKIYWFSSLKTIHLWWVVMSLFMAILMREILMRLKYSVTIYNLLSLFSSKSKTFRTFSWFIDWCRRRISFAFIALQNKSNDQLHWPSWPLKCQKCISGSERGRFLMTGRHFSWCVHNGQSESRQGGKQFRQKWLTSPATSGTGGLLVKLLVALEPTGGH